jgi:hypothetical protein
VSATVEGFGCAWVKHLVSVRESALVRESASATQSESLQSRVWVWVRVEAMVPELVQGRGQEVVEPPE